MNNERFGWDSTEEEIKEDARLLNLIDQRMSALRYFIKYTKQEDPHLSPVLQTMAVEKALKEAEEYGLDKKILNYIKKEYEELKKAALK